MQGYQHPLYAKSFSDIGEPIYLPKSQGWLIKRQIPGTPYFDAMGPYPLFFCNAWEGLPQDLDLLSNDLVSVSLVIAPFTQMPSGIYQKFFNKFFPYKNHYILDLSIPLDQVISKGRRKDAKRALQNLSIDIKSAPEIDPFEWYRLYQNLISRHDIKGIRAFSEKSFISQLSIPGMYFIRAFHEGRLIGGSLYLEQGDSVYFHLSAFLEEAYKLDAAYAVKWTALHYFKDRVRWMNLGGSTVNKAGQLSGLDKFKQGWSSQSAESYFCGKILNRTLYDKITEKKENLIIDWFPAYRAGDY